MHFGTKSYLKNTRNHTAKHALSPFSVCVYEKEAPGGDLKH